MSNAKDNRLSDGQIPEQKTLESKEFPDRYEITDKLKAPLNKLTYNLNFLFEDDYPAKMPADFARDMILLYSNEGDWVWDGMGGSGVVPRQAAKLKRNAIYSDINPKALDIAVRQQVRKNLNGIYELGDARTFNPTQFTDEKKIDLILSSPPFGLNIAGDKNHYSNEDKDLSNSENYQEFFSEFEKCLANYFKHLKGGGLLILDAKDRTKSGIWVCTILEFIKSAQKIGFELFCRYYYEAIPWTLWTVKDKENQKLKPVPFTMDVVILKKPLNSRLDNSV